MESERILKRQTKSPIGSISMVESFDACPHEESEAHEEDDIDWDEEEEDDIASATHGTVTFGELSPERRAKRPRSDPDFAEVPDFFPLRSPLAVSDPPETSMDGLKLMEVYPWCKPVSLEKDARSGIPDIETKKYCVDESMRFVDFVDFIRKQIKHRGSLFVYVNDREPQTDFLMYQVYANNMDKYGFLRMTYSGECRVCGLGNISPRIVDNVAARSDIIPDMVKEGMKLSFEEQPWELGYYFTSTPIRVLDPWNRKEYKEMAAAFVENRPDNPEVEHLMRRYLERGKQRTIDACELRKECKDQLPVRVFKDAGSDIPDIDTKKYLVHGDMPVREFVDYIRICIGHIGREEPMFVYFKKSVPPTGALMSAIEEENKDEDGFLCIAYGGEEKGVCVSYQEL
ncbi:hypothetical protein C1H46_017769 [Malus baccata]|uniref:Autophagy-related protein n=1 Tax=Malus baccata TaxID=106549 RepID=A0A540MCZ2_MALBA|nr:hypothetical protein C1H46_017769 [Malus baccata]